MRRAAGLLACALLAGPTLAQDGDGGSFLERTLENALSGEGRDVVITGFRGALSSNASLDRLTFSDADGIWLRLETVDLVWSRAALLRGRVEVDRLTAAEIEVVRPPLPANEMPSAEAPGGFSLPELPVSVNVGEISAQRVILGEALMGLAATLSVEGNLTLAGGEGSGRIVAERLDGPQGSFTVEGGFSNATGILSVRADVEEAAGGLVATLAGLPDDPALDLAISGEGPLDDFAADLTLATDGTDRITGALAIAASGPENADTGFRADLSGDVAPLLFPAYQAFFGPDISLAVEGAARADGSVGIETLDLAAAQLRLAGTAEIGADGLPDVIDLTGRISSEDGTPVLLPMSGAETRVDGVDLRMAFDAAASEGWTALIEIAGLDRDGLTARSIRLDGEGRIAGRDTSRVTAALDFIASDLDLGDADAQAALGEDVTGRIDVDWSAGAPIEFTTLKVDGESYGLDGRATVATDDGLEIDAEARVTAQDLSVFSGLAQRPLSGSITADLTADAAPVSGLYDIALSATGDGLATGIAEVDQLLEGRAEIDLAARRDETGSHIDRFTADTDAARIAASASLTSERGEAAATATLIRTDVIAPDLPGPLDIRLAAAGPTDLWEIDLSATGPGTDVSSDATLDLTGDVPRIEGDLSAALAEISPLSPRLGREVGGRVALTASGSMVADLSSFDLAADLSTTDLAIDQAQADSILAGGARLRATVSRAGDALRLSAFDFASPKLTADASGTASLGASLTDILTGTGAARVVLLESDGVLPGMPVPLSVTLDADGTPDALDLDFAIEGQSLTSDATARVALSGDVPDIDLDATLAAADIAPFSALAGRRLRGALDLSAEGRVLADLSEFDLQANMTSRNLSIGQADVDALLAGAGRAVIDARRRDGVVEVSRAEVETAALNVSAAGTTGLSDNGATFDLRLANVGRWVPGFQGPATVSGTASQVGGGDWTLDLATTAPGGTRAAITGSVAPSFDDFDLSATGSLPLQAANTFIEPMAVSGTAGFDLRLDGAPALGSLSGRIRTDGARFTAPTLGLALTDLGAQIDLANSGLRVDAGAQIRGGGRLEASGPIGLAAPFPAELRISLIDAVVRDPSLYRTTINGAVEISGGLGGGARIGGLLDLGETEIRIPSGVSAGVAPNFDVAHVNEPADVRRTRERAGLIVSPDAAANGGGGGPVYPLGLTIRASNRVFLRGRGLEAELGGQLRLGGTTANIVPVGQFELIRGRLDLLGQRISIDEGSATLQGDFDPFVRLVAATQQDDTLIRIVVQGNAASPDILFQSEPNLPEDEVLSRLLFGRSVENLSPLQAAQLAGAVANLAGRGGDGLVNRLRQSFGLDDLDVAGDGSGGTSVRAGKYISDNIYSDVTVDSEGEADVTINLDLSESVTVRGTAGSTGETGIGIFFERDY